MNLVGYTIEYRGVLLGLYASEELAAKRASESGLHTFGIRPIWERESIEQLKKELGE